ncbi:MAG: uracil-DNA glycosylase [Actinomycetota bacterium]
MADSSRRPKRSASSIALRRLSEDVVACRACPRLVAWREEVQRTKRAAYAEEEYWGRGVPGFGDPEARMLFLGLAPAAHGANRTGRIFTGDRSGDWLFRGLHRFGLANQPESRHRDDGLELSGAWVTSAVKCAPPGNKPTPAERRECCGFMHREFAALTNLRVIVCLGAFAYEVACEEFGIRPRPRFAHGAVVAASGGLQLVCSFHPSQQNTFTGRLTEAMFDDVIGRAVQLAGLPTG